MIGTGRFDENMVGWKTLIVYRKVAAGIDEIDICLFMTMLGIHIYIQVYLYVNVYYYDRGFKLSQDYMAHYYMSLKQEQRGH